MNRVFIIFDYDHDEDLRTMLVGQARHPDTPFEIADWSVREPFPGNWIERVRERIRRTDLTIVVCGLYTHTATGVATELDLTRREGKTTIEAYRRLHQLVDGPAGRTARIGSAID